MMKQIYWLLATVLILSVSCSKDDFSAKQENEGLVNFSFTTAIPQGINTYAYASHEGGAKNVDENSYDLRYILEVWTKDGRLAYRDYQIVPENFATASVTFTANLLAMEYDFVFWADFVDNGTTADLYYKTNDGKSDDDIKNDPTCDKGLTDIQLRQGAGAPAYEVSDEARDAFYAVAAVNLSAATVRENTITLKRPFGKFRLISTDVTGGSAIHAKKSKIQYTGAATFPAGFNALTGVVNTAAAVAIDLSSALLSGVTPEDVVVNGITYSDAQILAVDYIFAAPSQPTLSFNVSVYSDDAATVKISEREISNVPIEANKLTTIIGNFYTNTGLYSILMHNPFDGSFDLDGDDMAAVTDAGVEINGVTWATRNVGTPGKFAATPFDGGYLYQWNSNVPWEIKIPLDPEIHISGYIKPANAILSVGVNRAWNPAWDGNGATQWAAEKDPCPPGWRIPVYAEIVKLFEGFPNPYTPFGMEYPALTAHDAGTIVKLPAYAQASVDKMTTQPVIWVNTDEFDYKVGVIGMIQKAALVESSGGNKMILPCAGWISPVGDVRGYEIGASGTEGDGSRHAAFWVSDDAKRVFFFYHNRKLDDPDWPDRLPAYGHHVRCVRGTK
ncbi:MAG: hypothetical protein LBT48_05985 [Prevotellaceae bacterium]|nr:hypothetical protein [Prevotellaceae bacterium]